jgi:hypothetical protein
MMRSVPPDPNALDADWGLDESDPESTRKLDSKELFARAGFAMEEPLGLDDPEAGGASGEADPEGKITLPPPVNEYVSKMMVHRSHSSSEITAVQSRVRSTADPVEEPPTVPVRKTIPWEPPPVAGSYKQSPLSKDMPHLGLECDEPGVPSQPGGRLAYGVRSEPHVGASLPDLGDVLLRSPTHPPSSQGFGDLDALDSPQVAHGWRAPLTPSPSSLSPSSRQRARMSGGQDPSDLDFRIDLGLGFEAPGAPADDEPMTPPPGTLRYGLLEEEEELDFRGAPGATKPVGSGVSIRPGGGLRSSVGALASLDAEHEQAAAPGLDLAEHLGSPAVYASGRAEQEQMKQRFELGDYGGALVLAEGLLEEDPNDWTARQYADSCTEMLRQMYQARLGTGSRVLRLAISPDQLRSLSLDHRAGFLLSCIDGYSSIDEILDVSGMQMLEALRTLYELVQEGIVSSD